MNLVKITGFPDEAREGLKNALQDDLDIIIKEVESGESQLYQVNDDSWLVTRLEVIDEKPQLVIVAFEGSDYIKVMKYLVERAKELGIASIRGHVFEKRIEEILDQAIEHEGLRFSKEIIYRVEV